MGRGDFFYAFAAGGIHRLDHNGEGKFIDLITKVKFDVAQDQDYLNAICKGKVKYISGLWDKMPFEDERIKEEDVKIFHYNLDLKPWQKDNVPFEEHFWHYAKTSGYYENILEIKKSWTPERIEKAKEQTIKLVQTADEQANDVVENAIILKIIDSVWDEKESPLVKKNVETKEVEEEFDIIDAIMPVKKQRG